MLKANVEQTTNDNATIRCVLDIKQGEWTKIEQITGHKKRNVSINEDIYTQTQNKFQTLYDENITNDFSNMNQVVDGVDAQLSDYCAKQQAKFKKSNTSKNNQMHSSKAKDTRQNPEMPGKSSMKNGCDVSSVVRRYDNKVKPQTLLPIIIIYCASYALTIKLRI